tara:strand:+ start:86 stop:517 length:432 start_codon:yes stop_codon:yes gene_type:complete
MTSDTNTLITEANGKNRFNYITIPLTVGYRFDIGKFSIAPRLGVGLRFAMGGNGRYVTGDLTNYKEVKLKTFTLSYHGSIEFAYRIKQFGVFLEPRFQTTSDTFNNTNRYWDWRTNWTKVLLQEALIVLNNCCIKYFCHTFSP